VRGLIDDAMTTRVETEKDTNDETGRLFVQNMSYTVTEADIKKCPKCVFILEVE
jgi:RNA recognition motif-containing protein